jgi:2'-5' RNA ligase
VPESNPTSTHESALIAVVSAAESLVNPFRARYDPSASRGIPAHVTVLYPFVPPEGIDEAIVYSLKKVFKRFPPFSVTFSQVMDFPDALFLAPEPADPFIRLTEAVAAAFPEYPPYGGGFSEVVPHLTVAQTRDVAQMEKIRAEFAEAAGEKLPITARVSAISLMVESEGRWQVRELFPLKMGN